MQKAKVIAVSISEKKGEKKQNKDFVELKKDFGIVGDEPVLLARRGLCPVAVDSDRVQAAAMLVDDGVDVIVSDDGLQHLRLERDYEICVIDGERGLGNRRLLPAGPLRESPQRLQSVDQVLVNGVTEMPDAIAFELEANDATRVNGSVARPLQGFKDTTVHAVAGIGNPKRFFDLLRAYGIQVIEHSHPDHAAITKADLEFGDDFQIFVTEKDAVKLGNKLVDKIWYVPVELRMDTGHANSLIERIASRLRVCQKPEQHEL